MAVHLSVDNTKRAPAREDAWRLAEIAITLRVMQLEAGPDEHGLRRALGDALDAVVDAVNELGAK